MKRLKPQVPIILYTGISERPDGTQDADLVLCKGMTPPEFLGAIASLLANSRSGNAANS
jgi:hypothetical protein